MKMTKGNSAFAGERLGVRLFRVVAYATFLFGAMAVVGGRSAIAEARRAALSLGRDLAMLEDVAGKGYLLRINGGEIQRSSARTELAVKAVLDRFEAHCREHPSALAEALADIPRALAAPIDDTEAHEERVAVVRGEEGDRGMVACFVGDLRGNGARASIDRLRAFATSSDLSALGRFRYVYAEARGEGSRVVTIWTDGPLKVTEMFPASGDAPGDDSPQVPRPSASRRTLSASVAGFPAAVRIYETEVPFDRMAVDTEHALAPRGFRRVALRDRVASAAYVRDDGAEIFLSSGRSGGRGSVAIVEAAGGRTEGAATR